MKSPTSINSTRKTTLDGRRQNRPEKWEKFRTKLNSVRYTLEIENTFACVRTGRGTAAIGSIEIEGPQARSVVQQIFRPAGKQASCEPGRILYGRFLDGGRIIDDGLVGIEGPDRLALHCHGNPLILRQILQVLQSRKVRIVTAEEMFFRRYAAESTNTIEAEARLESLKAVSRLGVQILQNQMTIGLVRTVRQWLASTDLHTIRHEANELLRQGRIAQRIIRGVRIVIAGPPNSGKSTLLNQFAGKQQALVSETPGTTRDWVTAHGRIEPLYIEWIDTAGLDEQLAGADTLETIAQQQTRDLLARCDLILYVLDGTKPPARTLSPPAGIPVVTILNKSDRPEFQAQPADSQTVPTSAKNGTGLENIARAIRKILQVDTFDPAVPIAFTPRQKDLLRKIASENDLAATKSLAARLFQDPKPV